MRDAIAWLSGPSLSIADAMITPLTMPSINAAIASRRDPRRKLTGVELSVDVRRKPGAQLAPKAPEPLREVSCARRRGERREIDGDLGEVLFEEPVEQGNPLDRAIGRRFVAGEQLEDGSHQFGDLGDEGFGDQGVLRAEVVGDRGEIGRGPLGDLARP